MKVALIGAGAVGSYFIKGFGDASNTAEFVVVAEGERNERLKKNGIKINGEVYRPIVLTPKEAGKCDVIVMAVKGTTLREAVNMLPDMIGEKTVVFSVLNGVDSEDIIGQKIGRDHVIHSIILIASRRLPNEVIYDANYPTKVYFGAVDITDAEEKMKMVEDAFVGTRINVVRSEDIMYDEWFKYARNITNNLPQAVLGAPAAMYTRSEHGLFLAEKLWQEVRILAGLEGVKLPEHVQLYSCADSSRYSTLQDLDNKKRTEVDSLCGYLMKFAEKNDIPVPYLEYTYHAIKALEEKNEGLFG